METTTIIALMACIGACISGIAAAISCYFTFSNTRPKIKFEIDKGKCNYVHDEKKSFASMAFVIRNTAMISGMIDEICILYDDKEYYAEDKYTDFDIKPFEIKNLVDNKIERNVNQLRLKCPIPLNGFSVIEGFILFPTFPAIQAASITVTIRYRLMNKKFRKRFRKILFSLVTADPVYPRQKHNY